ncbi:hypothetical protein F4212_08200 [Candidatus Poribacteria bacterium]|nr:hypothetical protein [Candidatus Poribacteria bacterium]
MIYIPTPPPRSSQKQRKDSIRREQRIRNSRLSTRPSLGKKMGNALSTSQGMSTLKIVLIYSILGMVLNWVLPHILIQLYPEILIDDAQYFGTLGAIIITGFFLIISLIKGIIIRNRTQQNGSDTQPSNTPLFNPKNQINRK